MTDEVEAPRTAFTKGWSEALREKECLPIKTKGGRVIRVVRTDNNDQSVDSSLDESEDDEGDIAYSEPDIVNDFDTLPVLGTGNSSQSSGKKVLNSGDSQQSIQIVIGKICSEIIADPEYALKRRKDIDENGDSKPKLIDLMAFLKHKDYKIRELAILSTFLVFKDICPGYRIRPSEAGDSEIQLKKETKKLRDFELALLAAYQSFLKYLDEIITTGFKKSNKSNITWDENTKLSLSALRCQCELIRSLLHFNFRSKLFESVIFYGAHMNNNISTICCDTIKFILQHDIDGDASYEIVKIITNIITTLKYEIPESFLRCLEFAKLQIHANDAKDIRKKAKQEKRKRKRQTDEVELGLLEADATSNKSIAKRFQADCLRDISLIYFRIIKMKIGFRLLPIALEGLGRISHLLDMDTMQDLLIIMRRLLEENAPIPPIEVRLLCIHCAMRTLSGPGRELGADEEIYIHALRQIIIELPMTFERWDIILECIELCLVKKTEARNAIVLAFVRMLLLLAPHVHDRISTVALALAHSILLRYPRARSSLAVLGLHNKEEDVVADMAMRALRDEASMVDDGDGDGSWALPLLNHRLDSRFKPLIEALSSRSIIPIPLRVFQAKENLLDIPNEIDGLFNHMSSTIRRRDNTATNNSKFKNKSKKKFCKVIVVLLVCLCECSLSLSMSMSLSSGTTLADFSEVVPFIGPLLARRHDDECA
eukprot:gene8932-18473_t